METRLNRFLAQAGLASRRKADELISSGRVKVNGRTVFELGIKVDPRKDRVTVDGRPISMPQRHSYYLFYKPREVVTTLSDPYGRPTIMDYIGKIKERVFPVGRLDWASEGLLLLTNDGAWAQKILHPSREVTKTYLCKLNKVPSPQDFAKLKRGVSIIGGKVRAEDVGFAHHGTSPDKPWVRVIVTEGKKHQVRQMFAKLGIDVLRLKRVAVGGLRLGQLKPGEWRPLTPRQIQLVFQKDTLSERQKKSAGRKFSKR